jgi:hypothetical protein
LTPSKPASAEAASLERLAAAARAKIIAPEPFLKQLAAVDYAHPDLNLRFRRVSSTTFAHSLEKTTVLVIRVAWHTSGS